LDGFPLEEVRPHVERWYNEARVVIGDVAFFEVWAEVITSWKRAKHPAFHDPLDAALATAKEQGDKPPVPERAGYHEPIVALAYRLLFWLTLDNHDFFISCRALAKRLGVEHTRAWRLLKMFEADGIIECVKRGRRPKATRYRWIGGGPLPWS